MSSQNKVDLTSLETYRRSCLEIARNRLGEMGSMAEIAAAEADLNAYPNLDSLSEPRGVNILDVESIDDKDLEPAREAVLDGRIFWEHAAAGEATRLKMGTKYLIHPPRDLMPLDKIARMIGEEQGGPVTVDGLRRRIKVEPDALLPLTLGQRHMLQLAFDLKALAVRHDRDPDEVLSRQKLLLILNEKTADDILTDLRRMNFTGFNRENFFFMVQPGFHGINLKQGRFFYDESSPVRLHNHGQMVMQETMDDQIFRLDQSGKRLYLKSGEFAGVLEGCLDKISYNIEDLDYLTASLDWPGLALALDLGRQGYNMIMEIVANDPEKPIKGGMAAYDRVLGRNVMIESFQLKGMPNADIKFLNKNFNHYTNPAASWRALKEKGLPMPLTVKEGYLYFQAIQGDINFLVRTAFVRRKVLKPIRSWKSAANTITAVNAMHDQDNQPGFREFAAGFSE